MDGTVCISWLIVFPIQNLRKSTEFNALFLSGNPRYNTKISPGSSVG
jgi:hypothetical protein